MSNVLFLGFAHSGKTVLMAVLSRYFQTMGGGHFGLNPKNNAAHRFMTIIPAKLANGEWPAQTTHHSDICKWDLLFDRNVITSIEMVDFPGEAYRALFDTNMSTEDVEAAKETSSALFEAISRSNNIFLLVNLADIKELTTDLREADLPWILCESIEYLKNLPTHPMVTILLSQADRYFKDPTTVDARKELLKSHSLFANRSVDTFEVIAVSAVGKVKIGEDGQEIPDLHNTFPINFQPLLARILVNTPLMLKIENLKEKISTFFKWNYEYIGKQSSTHIRSLRENLIKQNQMLPGMVEKFAFLLDDSSLNQIGRARDSFPKAIDTLENLLQRALKREAEELERKREAERRKREEAERMRRLAEEDAQRAREAEERKRRLEEEAAREQREKEERKRRLEEEAARKQREKEERNKHLETLWSNVKSTRAELLGLIGLMTDNKETSITSIKLLKEYLTCLKCAYTGIEKQLQNPYIEEALAAVVDPERKNEFPDIMPILLAKKVIVAAKEIEATLIKFIPIFERALRGPLEQLVDLKYWNPVLTLTSYPAIHNLINVAQKNAYKKMRFERNKRMALGLIILLIVFSTFCFIGSLYVEVKHKEEVIARRRAKAEAINAELIERKKEPTDGSNNVPPIHPINESIDSSQGSNRRSNILQRLTRKERSQIEEDLEQLTSLSFNRLSELKQLDDLPLNARAEVLKAYTKRGREQGRLNFSEAEQNYKKAIALGSSSARYIIVEGTEKRCSINSIQNRIRAQSTCQGDFYDWCLL